MFITFTEFAVGLIDQGLHAYRNEYGLRRSLELAGHLFTVECIIFVGLLLMVPILLIECIELIKRGFDDNEISHLHTHLKRLLFR